MGGAAAGGQHVVGAGAVVTQADGGERTDEDRATVGHPRGHRGRVAGLDLQVLGGVGVDDLQPRLDVVDEHDAGLAGGQRGAHPLVVLGRGDPDLEGLLHRGGQGLAVGDQDRRREDVVLGLADQVGGDVHGVGAVVGQDRDLGRPRLGVDADQALEQPLGGDDVDVAGAGHQVDRLADDLPRARFASGAVLAGAVGEHRDGLGPADGVDLLDPQQRARGEDRGVGVAGEDTLVAALGRAGHGQGPHPGGLGGHDVHDHAAGQDRDAAGDVEADPVDRHPPLGHGATGDHLGGGVGAALVLVHQPGPTGRLLQRGADVGVQDLQGGGQHLGGHAQPVRAHAVEPLAEVTQRRRPAVVHVLTDGAHRVEGGLDVVLGSGQGLSQRARVERTATQVDRGHHPPSLGRPAGRPRRLPAPCR